MFSTILRLLRSRGMGNIVYFYKRMMPSASNSFILDQSICRFNNIRRGERIPNPIRRGGRNLYHPQLFQGRFGSHLFCLFLLQSLPFAGGFAVHHCFHKENKIMVFAQGFDEIKFQ